MWHGFYPIHPKVRAKMVGIMNKVYLKHQYKNAALNSQYVIASCGMMDEDVSRLKQILDACPAVPAICLDVANGYSEHFVEFVKNVRSKFPEHIIMVLNKLNLNA